MGIRADALDAADDHAAEAMRQATSQHETKDMSKYEELDAAILAAIKRGKTKFYIISALVEPLALPHSKGPHDAFRAVDRRLQALRKAGQIEYRNGTWRPLPTL
jgi:hypothetical protein